MAKAAHGSNLDWFARIFFMFARGSELNSVLFDAWSQCDAVWEKSKFLMQVRERHLKSVRGQRLWLMASEMDAKWGWQIGATNEGQEGKRPRAADKRSA